MTLLQTELELRQPGKHARLCLGTMNFGRRTDEAESKRILARAFERGIRLFDTANAYTDGNSERIVGELVAKHREDVLVATKCGFGRTQGKPEGLSKARILGAIDESLERLKADYVDIYYLHVPDHATPIEESLEALEVLLAKKKIRAWGVSNYAAWQILEMRTKKGAGLPPPPVIAQQLYNVLIRQLDVEYLPFAKQYGLHTTIYNPLAGGLLTGKHTRDGSTQKGSRFDKNRLYQGRYFTDVMFDRVEALTEIAVKNGLTILELAYAWAAGAPGVDSIILGPASVEQLDSGIDACARELAPELRTEIDALCRAWEGTDTKYVR